MQKEPFMKRLSILYLLIIYDSYFSLLYEIVYKIPEYFFFLLYNGTSISQSYLKSSSVQSELLLPNKFHP